MFPVHEIEGTEAEDFIVETQEVNFPLVKGKHRREGGGQAMWLAEEPKLSNIWSGTV